MIERKINNLACQNLLNDYTILIYKDFIGKFFVCHSLVFVCPFPKSHSKYRRFILKLTLLSKLRLKTTTQNLIPNNFLYFLKRNP